jgi:hypothetical protein
MAKELLGIALSLCILLSSFGALGAAPAKKPSTWADLPADQQQILAPLAPRWNDMSVQRKTFWLGIAKTYPSMPAEDQAKTKVRMEQWVKLSQEERRTVREGYKIIQKLPPEKKQTLIQQWDEYNKLPEEERRRLSITAKTPPPKAPATPAVAPRAAAPAK